MEIIHAGLLSGSVIMYQIVLGLIQLAGYGIGGRFGGIIASIVVAIWTYTQTWGDLFALQMVVQGGIAFFLIANADDL